MNKHNKIFIHCTTDGIYIYNIKDLTPIKISEYLNSENSNKATILENFINCLNNLNQYIEVIDNKYVRMYATGIFQELSETEQNYWVNRVFIDYGIYLNIISIDLELFYLQQCKNYKNYSENIINSILQQEFRQVVVCGSFQQSLYDIENIINYLKGKNIEILSPKSTKIKQETIGTPFILFDYQDYVKNDRDTWRHKFEHMEQFKKADAIIVCNPNGIIGRGTIFEFGFMVAHQKRIIFTEQPTNISVFFPYEVGLF